MSNASGVRFLLFLTALAVACAAPASSQVVPAPTVTVTLQGLPANATINGSLLAIPFEVVAQVTSTAPCLSPGAGEYDFALTAELVNSTGNRTTVDVSPATVSVSGPGTQPDSASRTTGATLLIDPGAYDGDSLVAQVRVTATSEPGTGGCTGGDESASASDSQDVTATFLPPEGYGTPTETGQELPASPLGLLLLGIASAAVVLRRK